MFVCLTSRSVRRHAWVLIGPDLNKILKQAKEAYISMLAKWSLKTLVQINVAYFLPGVSSMQYSEIMVNSSLRKQLKTIILLVELNFTKPGTELKSRWSSSVHRNQSLVFKYTDAAFAMVPVYFLNKTNKNN